MRTRAKAVTELMLVDDLEVWVTRKSMKTVRMHVKSPDGRVEVSAPRTTTKTLIRSFVRQNRAWIDQQRVAVSSSTMAKADAATDDEKRMWKKAVEECSKPLIEQWARILNVKPGKLAYRNMTSKWGSCQPSTGRICLNTRLALYPPECLEYVVVHELCHLRVSGHTREFWSLVETCLPNYREAKAKLK